MSCGWVWPTRIESRSRPQYPLMIEERVTSPPVTKVMPPCCTSVSTLLVTRYQNGLSQIADTLPWAQWNDEVKWSITVGVHGFSLLLSSIIWVLPSVQGLLSPGGGEWPGGGGLQSKRMGSPGTCAVDFPTQAVVNFAPTSCG